MGGGGVGGVDDGVDGFVAFALADGEKFSGLSGFGFEVVEEGIAVALQDGEGFGVGGMAFGEEVSVGNGGFGAFLDHALGEVAGGFDKSDVVHQGEGLKWGVGDFLADVADLAAGAIEDELAGRGNGTLPIGIHTFSVEVGAFGGGVFCPGIGGDDLPESGGLVGFDGRAAEFVVEEAGSMKGHVTDGETVHAIAWTPGEEAVFGVTLVEDGVAFGRLLESVAGDEEAIHFFDIPAGVHEFDGKPVEELGVAGEFALEAKILRCFDEADGEEVLPHPVDSNAGSDGITA